MLDLLTVQNKKGFEMTNRDRIAFIVIPSGYASAQEFADDCGYELFVPPIEGVAQTAADAEASLSIQTQMEERVARLERHEGIILAGIGAMLPDLGAGICDHLAVSDVAFRSPFPPEASS